MQSFTRRHHSEMNSVQALRFFTRSDEHGRALLEYLALDPDVRKRPWSPGGEGSFFLFPSRRNTSDAFPFCLSVSLVRLYSHDLWSCRPQPLATRGSLRRHKAGPVTVFSAYKVQFPFEVAVAGLTFMMLEVALALVVPRYVPGFSPAYAFSSFVPSSPLPVLSPSATLSCHVGFPPKL